MQQMKEFDWKVTCKVLVSEKYFIYLILIAMYLHSFYDLVSEAECGTCEAIWCLIHG